MQSSLITVPIVDLLRLDPGAADFLKTLGINPGMPEPRSLTELVNGLPDEFWEDYGLNREEFLAHFILYTDNRRAIPNLALDQVWAVTVIGGHDKSGEKEAVRVTFHPGEVIGIVGPTGSGKSRLLADIECLAQRDTPTERRILINHQTPEPEKRFAIEHKLVAQLSQNMNFVVDLTVEEFVTMHAESRMVARPEEAAREVMTCANELAGEKFAGEVPVTQLSGGQSRALMIADTALLSRSPVVLIDEIENAGVDRKKALKLLVQKGKIVLISTHDPLLALLGGKRLVIKNGGIRRVIETGEMERRNLTTLEEFDLKFAELRDLLRNGAQVDFDIREFLAW